MGTQIILTVTTKNNVVFTQEAKSDYDIRKNPQLFFSRLEQYVREYYMQFNRANVDKIASISVSTKDNNNEIFGFLGS